MSEKEKMEKVYNYIQELGLSPRVVEEYLSARVRLTPEEIRPGMFVYVDNTFCTEVIEGLQIKAVVGYVEGHQVYAVCLGEDYLPWSRDLLVVQTAEQVTNGKEATAKILEASRQEGKSAEAAQWCYDYEDDGVKKGEAFLPTIEEQKKLCFNLRKINNSLKVLGKREIRGYYWSCVEKSTSAEMLIGAYNRCYCDTKRSAEGVRPMLVIEL